MNPWEPTKRSPEEVYAALSEASKSFDGKTWAKYYIAFVRQIPPPIIDESLMESWFCNAIMTGYDAGRSSVQDCGNYKLRVIKEKQELDTKLEKLQLFIVSTQFNTVPPSEQERMSRQLKIMQQYSQVLGERIKAFSNEEDED